MKTEKEQINLTKVSTVVRVDFSSVDVKSKISRVKDEIRIVLEGSKVDSSKLKARFEI